MQVARVIGTVVCTRKDEGLAARTLLLVQPLSLPLSGAPGKRKGRPSGKRAHGGAR